MSLLGAVAYLSHTRIDILVFICALQRHTSKPKIIHVKRLNKLLTWVQRNPKIVCYRKLVGGGNLPEANKQHTHCKAISDAAYKKEPEDGYSLRGAVFLRGAGPLGPNNACRSGVHHLVDQACRSQRKVSRSTFSAELQSGCDAVDQGILIAQMIYEVEHGVLSAAESKKLRDDGGYSPLALYLDAKSVWAAITATNIKVPTDKSLLAHVQYIRELLDHHVLDVLVWIDTRDMVADGLTKGAVHRDALHKLMDGSVEFKHENSSWQSKASSSSGGNHPETAAENE